MEAGVQRARPTTAPACNFKLCTAARALLSHAGSARVVDSWTTLEMVESFWAPPLPRPCVRRDARLVETGWDWSGRTLAQKNEKHGVFEEAAVFEIGEGQHGGVH